jgi:hypothetical protein
MHALLYYAALLAPLPCCRPESCAADCSSLPPRSITYDLFKGQDEQHENICLAETVEGQDYMLLEEVINPKQYAQVRVAAAQCVKLGSTAEWGGSAALCCAVLCCAVLCTRMAFQKAAVQQRLAAQQHAAAAPLLATWCCNAHTCCCSGKLVISRGVGCHGAVLLLSSAAAEQCCH